MNTKHIFIRFIVLLALVMTACSTAVSTPQPTAEPTLAPTVVPTSTPAPDPAAVVQSFWDAMSAGDVDAAMAFFTEDAKCRGSCYLTGKDSLRAYIQGMVGSGNVTEISDLVVDGDTVTYFFKVSRNDIVVDQSKAGESMQILNGKIIFWNCLHI